MRTNVFLALALAVPSLLYGQAVEARISAEPPLSPDEVSQLESNLIANPANKEARLRLLRYYMAFGPRRMDILGMTSPDGGPAKRAAGEQERLRENARFVLDRQA